MFAIIPSKTKDSFYEIYILRYAQIGAVIIFIYG